MPVLNYKRQELILTTMLESLVTHYSLVYDIYGWYTQHEISPTLFTFRATFYFTKTWSKFPTFILPLMYLCISIHMYSLQRKNCQHLILAHPKYNNKSIKNIMKDFRYLWKNHVYLSKGSLTLVYLKLIAKIL